MTHIYDPISNILFDLGFITWYKYSFMIMLGIVLAVILGLREGKKLGITADDILDGVLIIVPLSIIGTRLWYVVFEWERYAWDIIAIFRITDGGLAIHGGFFTAFISAYFYTKHKGINLLSAFDIMVPGFLIAQASGRWGNFFNQEAHGGPIGGFNGDQPALSLDEQRTFLSKTLRLPDFITNNMLIQTEAGEPGHLGTLIEGARDFQTYNYYHPTFLYESLWNILGFGIVLIVRRTKWLRRGELLAFYLIWYSIGRYFIEAMRTDSLYVGDTGIRTAQLISIIMILGGIGYLIYSRFVLKPMYYLDVIKQNTEQIDEEAL
ncbi:MAG: prolipoprotein diacylglyceryl transferase [Candidatus Izimaplasma sp.]|nr:prolipoprotein diacylglyceryl transferase [Candidatus Izimaplasma bacterium]